MPAADPATPAADPGVSHGLAALALGMAAGALMLVLNVLGTHHAGAILWSGMTAAVARTRVQGMARVAPPA